MEIEIKTRQSRTTSKLRYDGKESIIIHSGKTDEKIESLWNFIEDALSKDITIICHEDGYYILSRNAYTGSIPHNTYECLSKDEEESDMIWELIKKHQIGEV